jgi:hypothetical protein
VWSEAGDRSVRAALALYTLVAAAAFVLAGIYPDRIGDSPTTESASLHAVALGSESLTYDDGFYYLKIAQQIARGAGSTFDGVHPTSGYHPLWLICLVPLFSLTSNPERALVFAVILQAFLMTVGVDLTYRIGRLEFGRLSATLGALLWVHAQLLYRLPLSGLEYALNAACTLTAIWYYRGRFVGGSPSPSCYLVLSIALCAALLARLDNVALAGCVVVALAAQEFRVGWSTAGARRILALFLPLAAAVFSYFVVNVSMFGRALPISGTIKRDWSEQLLDVDSLYEAHGWLVAKLCNAAWPFGHMKRAYVLFLVAGSAGAGALWLWAACVRDGDQPRGSAGARQTATQWFARTFIPWGPIVAAGALQIVFYVVIYHDGYSFQRWYFVLQPWLGALLVAGFVEVFQRQNNLRARPRQFAPRSEAAISVAVVGCVVLLTARTLRQWRSEALLGFFREPLFAAANWIGSSAPDGAVIGSWNAGTLGYLSGRSVVNLDGLVNSWEFYLSGRHDLCEYWRETGVTYLVDTFEAGGELDFFRSHVGVGPKSCLSRLERVWVGPAYSGTSQHAEAFRLR